MDLARFALVTLVCALLTETVKRKAPRVWARLDLFVLMALGIGTTFLVSWTTWAHTQVFMGVALDNMRIADRIVAGLIVAGAAWGFSQVVQKAVPSIGANRVEKPVAR